MVFITLTTIFVVIIVCCAIEVYRTNLAHKKRMERETDEGIIWSKEQATKLHDSPGQGVKSFSLKPVSIIYPLNQNRSISVLYFFPFKDTK